MLRSHHHLRGFVKLDLWDVYCVNGCGSFWLGYVGVGFGGNSFLQTQEVQQNNKVTYDDGKSPSISYFVSCFIEWESDTEFKDLGSKVYTF